MHSVTTLPLAEALSYYTEADRPIGWEKRLVPKILQFFTLKKSFLGLLHNYRPNIRMVRLNIAAGLLQSIKRN